MRLPDRAAVVTGGAAGITGQAVNLSAGAIMY